MVVIKENIELIEEFTTEILERYVVNYFCPRKNLIVPNVSWGLFQHECDLIVLTRSNVAYEIELKISKHDLKQDQKKRHKHNSKCIQYLYFALPYYLGNCIEYVPEHAGILLVQRNGQVLTVRKPRKNNDFKFTDEMQFQLARLGTLRIWSLKQKLLRKTYA